MNEEQIRQLSIKYLNGTATPEERQTLLTWYRNISPEVNWPAEDEQETTQIHDRVLVNLQEHIQSRSKTGKYTFRWVAAASILLLCSLAFLERSELRSIFFPIKQLTALTKYGQHKQIIMSDGTKVWLLAGSEIHYPAEFNSDTREVSFSGEAVFDVAKDKAHPYIIHSGNVSTKVLGTTFDLSAYKEQKQITVTLITGKVTFSDKHNTVTILPNERATYDKDNGNITSEHYPDAQKLLARRDGNYEYDNLPVIEIINDLRRNYNLNITIEGPIDKCLFYGRIKENEDPEKFLRKLCLVMNATLKKEGNAFVILGGGCP